MGEGMEIHFNDAQNYLKSFIYFKKNMNYSDTGNLLSNDGFMLEPLAHCVRVNKMALKETVIGRNRPVSRTFSSNKFDSK